MTKLIDYWNFDRKVFNNYRKGDVVTSMKYEKIEPGVTPLISFGPIPSCPPKPCGCVNI
jgi:hypothetical protein